MVGGLLEKNSSIVQVHFTDFKERISWFLQCFHSQIEHFLNLLVHFSKMKWNIQPIKLELNLKHTVNPIQNTF